MTAATSRFIESADVIERRVLFAVELVDPVTQALVWQDVTVVAAGLSGAPIISRSGRFVWLIERDTWPGVITVTPQNAPFAPHIEPAPPRPADILTAPARDRLVRIALRSTAAYGFDTGLTVVRGCLRERSDVPTPPIPGARVQLAWHDTYSDAWVPPPPQPGEVLPETDTNGEFAVILRLNPPVPADPDLDDGLLKARLQFTRGVETRATPDDFPFLTDPGHAGRLPEGRLLPRDVTLGWSELTPI